MPKRKNNSPVPTNKKITFGAQLINDQDELKNHLLELMKTSEKNYHNYLESKNKEIKELTNTIKKFKAIMVIIEKNNNPTDLTNTLYFQAWTSILYFDIYNLENFGPNNEDQLQAFNKKTLEIEIEINQLSIKKMSLSNKAQLKRIDNLQKFWIFNKNKLQGKHYYNLAESFIRLSDFEKSIAFLKKSAVFLREAAKQTIYYKYKSLILKFIDRINKRTDFAEMQFNKSQCNVTLTPPLEKLVIHLKKLSDESLPQWKIVKPTSLPPTKTENFSKASNLIKNTRLSNPRKRKWISEKKRDHAESKKSKKNCPSVIEDRVQWETVCKQLLNQFKEIKINDQLEGILDPFHKKSFNERKAIIHNNYAITIIENIKNSKRRDPHLNKLVLLDKAKSKFEASAKFYTQAGLIKEKGKITVCIDSIILSIEKLRTLSNNTSMTAISEIQKEPIMGSHLKTPYYLTRTFAKNLSSENKANIDNHSETNGFTLFR